MNVYSGTSLLHKRLLIIGLALLVATVAASASDATGSAPLSLAPPGPWHRRARLRLGDRDVAQLGAGAGRSALGTEDQWLRFKGTSVVKQLLDQRANVVELDISGPAGRIQALNFRLYESGTDRWSSTFANLRDGLITPSVYGTFDDGDATFYGKDQLGGRPIDVRFVIIRRGPDRARFEQAYSDDGGETWETNWISVDRRIG